MLFFTDKPNELFDAWNKESEGVDVDMVDEIKEDHTIVALIMFSNCTPDKKGMANVTVKYTLLGPDGSILNETGELEVWVNRPAHEKRMLELSVDYLAPHVKKKTQPGFYTVKALVHDKNSDTKLNLDRKFRVIENRKDPKYILAKVITRSKAENPEIFSDAIKESNHLVILSHILPNGIWEMGPDANGKIVTTSTAKNLSEWPTYILSQKYIRLGDNYVDSRVVEVHKENLIKAIKLYDDSWVGQKYDESRENDNYAVETVIYGAGGDINNSMPAKD